MTTPIQYYKVFHQPNGAEPVEIGETDSLDEAYGIATRHACYLHPDYIIDWDRRRATTHFGHHYTIDLADLAD